MYSKTNLNTTSSASSKIFAKSFSSAGIDLNFKITELPV